MPLIRSLDPPVNNRISNDNSTSTTLGSGAIFTGNYVNCEQFDTVGILVSSGASGTLESTFSSTTTADDITYTQAVNNFSDFHTTNITNGEYYAYDVVGKYFKLKFTNDVESNTHTRITTTLKVGAHFNGMNKEVRIIEPAGNVVGIDINLGRVADDIQRNDIYGFNDDVDVADGEQILGYVSPFAIFPSFPTSATTMIIASTSVNDTAGGTGARDWLIFGLSADGTEIEEEGSMNGQTAVTTTTVFNRVNEAIFLTAGTLLTNDGTISITDSSDSFVAGVPQLRVYNTSPPGFGYSTTGMFTVPKDKFLIHIGLEINTTIRGDLNNVTIKLKANNDIVEEISDVLFVHDNTNIPLNNTRARIAGQDVWITYESTVNNIQVHIKMMTMLASDKRGLASFIP